MRSYVSAKLHNISVTDKSLQYDGSVGIGRDLLEAVGIDEYEQVQIINLATGARWTTYAIAINAGRFSLNGGGARLGEFGDRCVILTYAQRESFSPARVAYCDRGGDGQNVVIKMFNYGAT